MQMQQQYLLSLKTDFTGGELSNTLYGHGDLQVYERGAGLLRNVSIHPNGGVFRRFGTQNVSSVPAAGRLVSFSYRMERRFLLYFKDKELFIFENDVEIARLVSPYSEIVLPSVTWTQNSDRMFFAHASLPPYALSFENNTWALAPFASEHFPAAFSDEKGWPKTVAFYQDRLVFGGTTSQPNRLWFSKIGNYSDFDLGEALDDEGIEFGIVSDNVNAIIALYAGRHLEVFTSGGEWIVAGIPLTPASIQLLRQTKIGSIYSHYVPPRDIDGMTVFAGFSGHDMYGFQFMDIEQCYQSPNLSQYSSHLVNTPVDMDYDPIRRKLYVVMRNGAMGCLMNYRPENVSAWSLYETAGKYLSVASVGYETYLLVERKNGYVIEKIRDDFFIDSGLSFTLADTVDLSSFNEERVYLICDGVVEGTGTVKNGVLDIPMPDFKENLVVGLPYTHKIAALSPFVQKASLNLRLVKCVVRIIETPVLRMDVGRGLQSLLSKKIARGALDRPQASYTGDVKVHGLGWVRSASLPPWVIEGEDPLPCHVVSVISELRTGD